MCTKIIIYGLVKKFVRPLFIFWIIFLLDLELNYTGKLQVFRCVLTVLLLLQICSYFVMREISVNFIHITILLMSDNCFTLLEYSSIGNNIK